MQDQVGHNVHTNHGPIRLLQPELLRLIFLENTRSPDHFHDQLLTARSSSQVCQQWREILLSSSVLWGRLIIVDELHFTKVDDAWRNEVLARGGSALLWIQGHVTIADHKIFVSFLEKHWERVERVDITGDREISYHPGPGVEFWKGFEFNAPNLKAFSLDYVGSTSPFSRPNTHITRFLFKDGAPKLREISVPDMKFSMCSPWLSNMRSMTLSAVFSFQDMFTILKATPLLTSLDITMQPHAIFSQWQHATPLEQSQQCITLSLLETFALKTYFHLAPPFLEFLDFPTACIPDIFLEEQPWADSYVIETDRAMVPIIRDLIIKRMKPHLPLRKITRLTINIAQLDMQFFFSGHDGIRRLASLHLNSHMNSPPHILEELSICDYLSPVKEMRLTVDVLLSPSSHYLARFSSCSVSLTTLVTDERTLKFFLDIKSVRQECVPFPALKVLKLTHFGPSSTTDPERYPSQVIRDFFQWQRTGPSPISVFDLSYIPFRNLPSLEYLDKAPGLKIVKWISLSAGPAEYECGTGSPMDLSFREIWRIAEGHNSLPEHELY